MGLATLAVTEVSHAAAQADEWTPEASNPTEAGDTASVDGAVDDHLDALLELGDEIATLAAHIHAAEYRFLTLIAEFDRLRGWEPGGHRSCAHWLAFRTGIDLGAARERVRAARALTELPQISASMAQGELSFAQVRALTRVATPESEGDLLELARSSTAAQLERVVRAWRRLNRWDEQELERMRHRSRCFSVFPDEDGMYVVRGRLDPEVGAMLMRAVEAASDALFRRHTSNDTSNDTSEEIEPKQRRADALGLLAERALAMGFGRTGAEATHGAEAMHGEDRAVGEDSENADGEVAVGHEGAAGAQGVADAEGEGTADGTAGAYTTPLSGSRAERYQVVLHVEAATLESEGEPGRSELEDGTRLSAETSRRLSCDASVVRLTEAPDGSVLDVGRKTRTIPPALRRALESRDRGCRFPGCGLRFTDAHHIRHWADGGETKLDNVILMCRFHHRLVHEEGYTVHFPQGGRVNSPAGRPNSLEGQPNSRDPRLYFLDPRMRLIPDAPPPPPPLPREPVEALVQQNRLRGVEPDFLTGAARYKREDDIPSAVFVRAFEALESSSGGPSLP